MYNREYTPERITSLLENEIFVFGSNLEGSHGGGAARLAYERFGAVWGLGTGIQGQSYAIPTMHGGVEQIEPYVEGFMDYAFHHRELTFYVTRIGCGIAGFTPYEIAPLFLKVIDLPNVILPRDFVEVLHRNSHVAGHPLHTWDSELDFLNQYRSAIQKVANGNISAYDQIKRLRMSVFRNTVDIVNHGFYISESGIRVAFPDDIQMCRNTVFYDAEIVPSNVNNNGLQTKFLVLNDDCLNVGLSLQKKGYNPAVLNMASRRNPGGGVVSGAGAQEEGLFRRTNLFRSLYQFVPYAGQYGVKCSHSFQYPLNRDFGGIYTPEALLFREDELHGYKLMDTIERFSFISVAGINHPDLKDAMHLADSMIEGTKNKMRTILRIGLHHRHDSLVLGALGCGAFCNPPSHIAQLFHEVFEEPEFKNKYRIVSFAVLDDHNAHKAHNPEGNYKPFVEEFVNS